MNEQGIFKAYQKADGLLAMRLEKIFVKIETKEDVALHNDALKDMLAIISGEEKQFFERMIGLMYYQKVNKRKRFIFRLADEILRIGHQKGQ